MEKEATSKRLAVIDIGSNTIRTVIYDWQGARLRKRYSERDYTGLIAYIRHARLSEEGVLRLCEVLAHMKRFCGLCRCEEILPFSTASLRQVENQAEVLARVREATGLEIRPLSAEEEMAFDCEALLRGGYRRGIGFDLGGGSCQVFAFGEKGVKGGASLPVGCLSLEAAYVEKGLFPTHEEARAIRKRVEAELAANLPGLEGRAPAYVLAMGGSARAVAKVLRAIQGEEAFPEALVSREAVKGLVREARWEEAKMVALLRRVIPGRMSTLLPGAVAMLAIAKYLKTEYFKIAPMGVREGFLWTYLKCARVRSTEN